MNSLLIIGSIVVIGLVLKKLFGNSNGGDGSWGDFGGDFGMDGSDVGGDGGGGDGGGGD